MRKGHEIARGKTKVLYELDGGDRTMVKAFKVKVEAGAVSVCVPATTTDSSPADGLALSTSEKTR